MFAALVAISIVLAVLAWKIRLIHRDTDYLASIVERSAQQAADQVEAEYDAPAPERFDMPIGFGVQLRND